MVAQSHDLLHLRASFTLTPSRDPEVAAAAAGGVEETLGAHWFAETAPDAATAAPAAGDGGDGVAVVQAVAAATADTATAATAATGTATAANGREVPVPPTGDIATAATATGATAAEAATATGATAAEAATAAATSPEAGVPVTVDYWLHSSGLLLTEWEIDSREALPAELPAGLYKSLARVGVSLGVSPGLTQVTWRGSGPWETYPDRKACGHQGVYTR